MDSSTGTIWLMGPMRPNVATTALTASSSGMPAASSVPNVTSRMTSVSGSESVPALARSAWKIFWKSSSELPSPNCSTMKSSWAASSFSVLATVASMTRFVSVSVTGSPGMSKATIATCSLSEMAFPLPLAYGSWTLWTPSVAFSCSTASWTTARNPGESASFALLEIRTASLSTCGKASCTSLAAVPESRTPASSCVSCFVPTLPPIMNARTTNASQPTIAVFQWRALQRPARAARLRDGCICCLRGVGMDTGGSLLPSLPPNIREAP